MLTAVPSSIINDNLEVWILDEYADLLDNLPEYVKINKCDKCDFFL